MSVLSDKTIRKLALEEAMISPFVDKQVRDGKISYGLSSFGYDARVADEFKIFHNVNSSVVDPKKFTSDNFVTKKSSEYIIIPPNSFALGTTIEIFKIPRNIMCIVVGKSTYARTGIICNVTPIENEFEGNIVIELSNTTPNPAKIYSNEGIAQFLFFKSDTQPETTYKSKNGKYQGQTTIQVAKIKK